VADAEIHDLMRWQPGDVLAVEAHRASGRVNETGYDTQRRGLAGPVRPQQRSQPPRR
jgi:hypothetical protein